MQPFDRSVERHNVANACRVAIGAEPQAARLTGSFYAARRERVPSSNADMSRLWLDGSRLRLDRIYVVGWIYQGRMRFKLVPISAVGTPAYDEEVSFAGYQWQTSY